jgi:DNA-binding MarR family transcriptional regulator
MGKKHWTFITNHAAVLTLLDRKQPLTAREIGATLDITTRSVYRIIKDLELAGYLTKSKLGRENRYIINKTLPLRRNHQREVQIQELLLAITEKTQE